MRLLENQLINTEVVCKKDNNSFILSFFRYDQGIHSHTEIYLDHASWEEAIDELLKEGYVDLDNEF